jgi:hypothetical protein
MWKFIIGLTNEPFRGKIHYFSTCAITTIFLLGHFAVTFSFLNGQF